MAYRFAKVFGGAAEVWLRHQNAYDLWELEHGGKQSRPSRCRSERRDRDDAMNVSLTTGRITAGTASLP